MAQNLFLGRREGDSKIRLFESGAVVWIDHSGEQFLAYMLGDQENLLESKLRQTVVDHPIKIHDFIF